MKTFDQIIDDFGSFTSASPSPIIEKACHITDTLTFDVETGRSVCAVFDDIGSQTLVVGPGSSILVKDGCGTIICHPSGEVYVNGRNTVHVGAYGTVQAWGQCEVHAKKSCALKIHESCSLTIEQAYCQADVEFSQFTGKANIASASFVNISESTGEIAVANCSQVRISKSSNVDVRHCQKVQIWHNSTARVQWSNVEINDDSNVTVSCCTLRGQGIITVLNNSSLEVFGQSNIVVDRAATLTEIVCHGTNVCVENSAQDTEIARR
ncbi:hypothetical protein [Actinomyces vulturis]|uniref:hypothetical protein n=1 Tax=Actinomyces vulturis TaxID=1857645 RepID=UPI0008356D6D|nr:hypothetical protein [Actinomyces vulturis]